MNPEKLKKLQNEVRIGGKGTQRRKKKVVHKTATTDDKKLQGTLKKMNVNPIPGIEEVNMIKDDGQVIHFKNPKVQASLAANTFAITGPCENKPLTDMLPSILNQIGAEGLTNLRKLAERMPQTRLDTATENDDDVPTLVENFDEPSKNEATAEATPATDTTPVTETTPAPEAETTPGPVAETTPEVTTTPVADSSEPAAAE